MSPLLRIDVETPQGLKPFRSCRSLRRLPVIGSTGLAAASHRDVSYDLTERDAVMLVLPAIRSTLPRK